MSRPSRLVSTERRWSCIAVRAPPDPPHQSVDQLLMFDAVLAAALFGEGTALHLEPIEPGCGGYGERCGSRGEARSWNRRRRDDAASASQCSKSGRTVAATACRCASATLPSSVALALVAANAAAAGSRSWRISIMSAGLAPSIRTMTSVIAPASLASANVPGHFAGNRDRIAEARARGGWCCARRRNAGSSRSGGMREPSAHSPFSALSERLGYGLGDKLRHGGLPFVIQL